MQLHEEKMNNKELAIANMKGSQKMLGPSDTAIEQSAESYNRMANEVKQFEESEAVKEYRFIT